MTQEATLEELKSRALEFLNQAQVVLCERFVNACFKKIEEDPEIERLLAKEDFKNVRVLEMNQRKLDRRSSELLSSFFLYYFCKVDKFFLSGDLEGVKQAVKAVFSTYLNSETEIFEEDLMPNNAFQAINRSSKNLGIDLEFEQELEILDIIDSNSDCLIDFYKLFKSLAIEKMVEVFGSKIIAEACGRLNRRTAVELNYFFKIKKS